MFIYVFHHSTYIRSISSSDLCLECFIIDIYLEYFVIRPISGVFHHSTFFRSTLSSDLYQEKFGIWYILGVLHYQTYIIHGVLHCLLYAWSNSLFGIYLEYFIILYIPKVHYLIYTWSISLSDIHLEYFIIWYIPGILHYLIYT